MLFVLNLGTLIRSGNSSFSQEIRPFGWMRNRLILGSSRDYFFSL
jgi:hypothetical protein